MIETNATHDESRRSWLDAANRADAEFPIQNLPLGMFLLADQPPDSQTRPGIAIGDLVLDLRALDAVGLLQGDAATAVRAVGRGLNGMMALGNEPASALRAQVSNLLRIDGDASVRKNPAGLLHPISRVSMVLPCEIGDYTDFLTSFPHTERHGRFKNLSDPVPPVFHSLPVAYHGRASSIRPSGMGVRRPNGQWRETDGSVCFGPVQAMDFELEVAALVGRGSALGRPVPLDQAPGHIFGYALLNDWSAKSVQWWEQMLGPFLGKSFMSTLSPWVITAEALAPFAMPAPPRRPGAPALLPYLHSARDRLEGGMDIAVEAWLSTQVMRDTQSAPVRLVSSHLSRLSWTFGQMLAHHASNGCNLNAGDLLGSGTISGEADEERACLTEITSAGREPLVLPNGEKRLWLHDGDEITLKARAHAKGRVSIGFGPCSSCILPAFEYPFDARTAA